MLRESGGQAPVNGCLGVCICLHGLPQGSCLFHAPRQHSRRPPLGYLLAKQLPSEPLPRLP